MTRRNDLLSYAPISVLVGLMTLFYSVFMLTVVLDDEQSAKPAPELYPNADLVNLGVVNALFFLTLVAFLRASFTKPGAVPGVHPWDPDCPPSYGKGTEVEKALAAKGLQNVRGLERKMDGRARFCRMCGRYKPDRAHHSSNMGECVLEMDHYCPWIRNCVGHRNKKYFFLLVLYGASSLIAYCVAMGPRFVYSCQNMHTVLDFFVVFTWILAALLGFIVTCFSFFHMWLMARAFTTIEFCEKRRADDSKRNALGLKVKELYSKSPYDLGVYHNVSHVLGPWPLWLVPTRLGMPNDIAAGCVFEVDPEHPMYKSVLGRGRGSLGSAGPGESAAAAAVAAAMASSSARNPPVKRGGGAGAGDEGPAEGSERESLLQAE